MRLFVYVVRYDVGFAPNPFFGYCTLATCKPRIRGSATMGDWVVGVGSTQENQDGKLVYAMQVQEATCFNDYWDDPRFRLKRPYRPGSFKQRYGDNIYHLSSEDGKWIQEDGRHSLDDGSPNKDHIKRDTSQPRVLISQRFVYYGDHAVGIPSRFLSTENRDMFIGMRDYRCNFPDDVQDWFIEWIEGLCADGGIAGEPLEWQQL